MKVLKLDIRLHAHVYSNHNFSLALENIGMENHKMCIRDSVKAGCNLCSDTVQLRFQLIHDKYPFLC